VLDTTHRPVDTGERIALRLNAMPLPTQLYAKIKQFFPIESNRVFWLNTHEFLPSKPVKGAQCRPLVAADIHKLSKIKDFGISQQLADDFETLGFVGIGIFVDKKLAGLSVFCTEAVPAHYNRTEERANGVDILLPPGTRALIKAVILPPFRGQRLNSAVVRYAIDHFGKDTVNAIVTTADIANDAYKSSVLGQGFEPVGKTTELTVLGKSVHRLPKPIDSNTGQQSDQVDCSISFRKAA